MRGVLHGGLQRELLVVELCHLAGGYAAARRRHIGIDRHGRTIQVDLAARHHAERCRDIDAAIGYDLYGAEPRFIERLGVQQGFSPVLGLDSFIGVRGMGWRCAEADIAIDRGNAVGGDRLDIQTAALGDLRYLAWLRLRATSAESATTKG